LGETCVLAGIVTSRIKARLLQPYASVEGLVVGVYTVPVTDGTTMTVAKNPWVEEARGDGRASAVFVASGVTVGRGVLVAGGTIAVWVWKKAADRVPMLSVRMAFMSGVGDSGGCCPPQETRRRVANRTKIVILWKFFIFTSMVHYWNVPSLKVSTAYDYIHNFSNCLHH
jgi:hypothetical protein